MSQETKNKSQEGLDETTKIIIAALAGAAVGATVALLFAPASGKETRDNLGEFLGTLTDSLKDYAEQGKDMAEDAVEKAKEVASPNK